PGAWPRGRKTGAKNYLRNPQNRLEPFGDLRELIGEHADKAGITAPIGAHAPPVPRADQRDPRGFPRPGGFPVFIGEFPLFSGRPTAGPTSTGRATRRGADTALQYPSAAAARLNCDLLGVSRAAAR